jgi:hypothetical protein
MKIKGAELAEFINNGWPSDDYYWDHDVFEDRPAPEETYDTDDLGYLHWQGDRHEDPTGGHGLDLAKAIRDWRKASTTKIKVIRIPKDVTDKDLRAALKQVKGTIDT